MRNLAIEIYEAHLEAEEPVPVLVVVGAAAVGPVVGPGLVGSGSVVGPVLVGPVAPEEVLPPLRQLLSAIDNMS